MFGGSLEAERHSITIGKPPEEWVDRGILESSPGGRMAWWSRGSTDQDRSIFLSVTDPGSVAASTGGASSCLYIFRERKTWSILLATPVRRSHVTEGTRPRWCCLRRTVRPGCGQRKFREGWRQT